VVRDGGGNPNMSPYTSDISEPFRPWPQISVPYSTAQAGAYDAFRPTST
jgi:hypothetical protein